MGATVIASIAGAFGDGPLSSNRLSEDSVSVSYQRFLRRGAPASLEIVLPAAAGEQRLWISQTYLHSFDVESILPPPETVAAVPGNLVYTFRGSGSTPLLVVFRMRPRDDMAGLITGRAASRPETAIQFRQFVYP